MPRTLIPLGVLRRPLRNVALMLLLLFLLLLALWLTLPRWLPTLANRSPYSCRPFALAVPIASGCAATAAI